MLPNYSHRIFSILVLSGHNHLWFSDASHIGDGEIIEDKKRWFLCVFALKQNIDLNSPHSSFQQHLVAGSPSVWPPPIRSSCPEKQKLSDNHFLCGMFSQRDFKPFYVYFYNIFLFFPTVAVWANKVEPNLPTRAKSINSRGWTWRGESERDKSNFFVQELKSLLLRSFIREIWNIFTQIISRIIYNGFYRGKKSRVLFSVLRKYI